MQTIFPESNGIFQDNNAPIRTAEIVQSWFKEHENEVKHLPFS